METRVFERSLANGGPGWTFPGFGFHLSSLRYVSGSVETADARARLRRIREVLVRSGAEMTAVGETVLRFRSPLSPSLDSQFPARDEFGPAPVQESSVSIAALGTSAEAIRFCVSMDDSFDLALLWFVFLLPFFVVSPALVYASGSPVAWLGVAIGLAGNAANGIHLHRLRSRTEAALRALLEASLED